MLSVRTTVAGLCLVLTSWIELGAQQPPPAPTAALCVRIEYKTCHDLFGPYQAATPGCETYECITNDNCYPDPEITHQSLTDCEWNQDVHRRATGTEDSSEGILAELKDGFICYSVGKCRHDCHFDIMTGLKTCLTTPGQIISHAFEIEAKTYGPCPGTPPPQGPVGDN